MCDHVRYFRCGGCGHPHAHETGDVRDYVCAVCGVPWRLTAPTWCSQQEYKASRADDATYPYTETLADKPARK